MASASKIEAFAHMAFTRAPETEPMDFLWGSAIRDFFVIEIEIDKTAILRLHDKYWGLLILTLSNGVGAVYSMS